MFYHHELLRKNGRFHICWLADSYPAGFARIKNSKIKQYHVSGICDDLIVVVNSESHNPRKKFSLRLSSQLVMGLLRIYERQINLLLVDLLSFDASVRKGFRRLQELPKVKKAKKLAALPENEEPLLSQQQLLDHLNNGIAVQRVGDITLRETVLPPAVVLQDDFGKEQDPIVELFGLPEDVRRMQDTSALDQTAFQVQVDVHADHFGRKAGRLGGSPLCPTMMDITQTVKNMSLREAAEPQITPDTSKVMEELNLPQIDVSLVPEINVIPVPEISEVAVNSTLVRPETLQEEEEEQRDVAPLPPRRKLKKVNILDQETILSFKHMSRRLDKIDIELRCQNATGDRICFGSLFSSKRLFSLPYVENANVRLGLRMSRCSGRLKTLYARNLITRPESSMQLETSESQRRKVREVVRAAKRDESTLRNITAANFSMDQTAVQAHTLPLIHAQPHPTVTSFKRKSEDAGKLTSVTSQRKKKSYLKVSEASLNITVHKDLADNITADQVQLPMDQISLHYQTKIPDVTEEVVEAILPVDDSRILENVDECIRKVERPEGRETERAPTLNETGLGSLDRTEVSLGDQSLSESAKMASDYLLQSWRPEVFLEKLWSATSEGTYPVTVETIVKSNPIPTNIVSEKRVAARAFMSLLHLKSSGTLKIVKNEEDLSIFHIILRDSRRRENL